MATSNIDLPGLIEKFHDEDSCRQFLEDLRWPGGITCPKCEAENITPSLHGTSIVATRVSTSSRSARGRSCKTPNSPFGSGSWPRT